MFISDVTFFFGRLRKLNETYNLLHSKTNTAGFRVRRFWISRENNIDNAYYDRRIYCVVTSLYLFIFPESYTLIFSSLWENVQLGWRVLYYIYVLRNLSKPDNTSYNINSLNIWSAKISNKIILYAYLFMYVTANWKIGLGTNLRFAHGK